MRKEFSVIPTALTSSVANLLSPPTITGGVYGVSGPFPSTNYTNMGIVIKHMRAVNTLSTAQNVSLFIGGNSDSAAGTEFAWSQTNIPPNGTLDWYGSYAIDVGQYLTGLMGASSSGVTLAIEGEMGIV